MICEIGKHRMQGDYCVNCGWLQKYINIEQPCETEFVQVKREDLEKWQSDFIDILNKKTNVNHLNHIAHEIENKYLGEKGGN